MKKIHRIPLYGQTGEHVKILQQALCDNGHKIAVDGIFGPQTKAAVMAFQKGYTAPTGLVGQLTLTKLGLFLSFDKSTNPAYLEAKKHAGKKETDKAFIAYLAPFWKLVGLPHFKTLIGASFAWCAMFIAAMNTEVGQQYISKGGALASSWARYGQAVDWKKNGIPRGAVVHIHSKGCGSRSSGNHVTFADGSCTAAYLATKGAVMPGYGGNQGNQVKTSYYSASKICAVRWPSEIALPPPVIQNDNCGSGNDANESTR